MIYALCRIIDNRYVTFHLVLTKTDDEKTVVEASVRKIVGTQLPPHLDSQVKLSEWHEKLVINYPFPAKVFIGESLPYSSHPECETGPYWDGNSVIIQPQEGVLKYIMVGDVVFSFETKTPIRDFYSPVLNNVVHYPYAITDDEVYLLGSLKVFSIQGVEPFLIDGYRKPLFLPYDDFDKFADRVPVPGFKPRYVRKLKYEIVAPRNVPWMKKRSDL